jgi:hypothetical protein
MICLMQQKNGITLSAGLFLFDTLKALLREDLALTVKQAQGHFIKLTGSGRSHLMRHDDYKTRGDDKMPPPHHDKMTPFARQHRIIEETRIETDTGAQVVNLNTLESPLAWLYRRKTKNGERMISAAQFMAGERLRRDMEHASLMPHMGVDWSRASVQTSASGSRDGLMMNEVVIAARARVNKALEAVGNDVSGLLMDVCGFLKSLKIIELEHGWPPRSAKVIVAMALTRLANHYGLSNEARGKSPP